MARQSLSQTIPTRNVQLGHVSELPHDYSSTPGGTIFSTTPGGETIRALMGGRRNRGSVLVGQLCNLCSTAGDLLNDAPYTISDPAIPTGNIFSLAAGFSQNINLAINKCKINISNNAAPAPWTEGDIAKYQPLLFNYSGWDRSTAGVDSVLVWCSLKVPLIHWVLGGWNINLSNCPSASYHWCFVKQVINTMGELTDLSIRYFSIFIVFFS